ncbi:MAG: FAD-dependent monooxygenase [bacterium]|nr:FAD-dependent monooxygenase [bacterium]
MDAPVIIVGGGPVGLALALALARYDVRSILLERALEPVRESRAVVIWPRTQEILRDWNVYDAVRAAGNFVTTFRALNACTDATLLSVDFSAVDDVVDDPGVIVLPQNDTETVLRRLVAAHPLCDMRLGAEVTALRPDARYVEVAYAQDGGERTLRGAYVVGCDGAHGIVRHALGLSLEGMTYDSRIVLSDEVLADDLGEDALARVRIDQPGICAAIRFAPRTWRVIASVGKDEDPERALSEAAHRERLRMVFGDVATTTIWSSIFNIHRRHAQRFVVGRVALAGDAAHLNSPAGGQGMNAGIQDAANLAWKLALTLRDGDRDPALFESYDVERREMVTDTIERYTDRLTRVALGFSPRTKQLAARTMWRAVRGRGMQRKLCRALGMLSGRYTKSPLVDARHPLAGRRIDDLRLPDGTRINHRRGGQAMLVVAGDFPLDLPHVRVPVAPKRWHVKLPVVLVVRPDGCVAAVVEKPTFEKIEAAWRRAFCGMLPLPVAAVR